MIKNSLPDLRIRCGWLIDGTGGPIAPDRILYVCGGNIVSEKAFPKARSRSMDLSGCTVLPALVDSHVHLFMSGTSERKIRDEQLDAPFETIRPVITRHLRQQWQYGVAAVRDGGDKHAHALRYKTRCMETLPVPLQVRVAGCAWHKPNRYGRLIGRTVPENGALAEAVQRETEPIDHVKVVNSGLNSLLSYGKQTAPQFTAREMRVAVEAAGRRGWKMMVHANGERPVRIAVDAACGSIEHGFFMGMENLQKMADRRVFWVPTAHTMQAFAEHFRCDTDVPRKNLEHQLDQMAAARKLGVPMAVGTDAGSLGVLHGEGMIEELKLFVQAGFSIQEALRCASANGAALLGLQNLGTLSPGKSATLVAVKGDPSRLPESLGRIAARLIDGKVTLCDDL